MTSTNLDYFNDVLDDHCIEQTLHPMEFEDLFIISQTCKRLKKLTNRLVKLKYRHLLPRLVHIFVVGNKIELQPPNKFLSCFAGCVETVDIRIFHAQHISVVAEFLRSNWSENGNLKIKRISLTDENLSEPLGKSIDFILEQVEIVELECVSEQSDFASEILKYCSRLQTLSIRGDFFTIDTNITCVTLEMVDCCIGSVNDVRKLGKFLQQSPNVKKLSCRIKEYGYRMDKVINTIKLVTKMNSIKEFYLSIDTEHKNPIHYDNYEIFFKNCYVNWALIHDELKKINERDNFNHLELHVKEMFFEGFNSSNLDSLNGLHLGRSATQVLEANLLTINPFAHVKLLSLTCYYDSDELFTSMSQTFPNLEELHLIGSGLRNRCTIIAANLPKLSALVCYTLLFDQCLHTMDQFESLNTARSELTDACKLTINLYGTMLFHENLKERTDLREKVVKSGDMVTIMMETVKPSRDIFNPINPLLPVFNPTKLLFFEH